MDYFHRELVKTMLHHGVDKVALLGREYVARRNWCQVKLVLEAWGRDLGMRQRSRNIGASNGTL